MNDTRRCSKCKVDCLRTYFQKNKNMSDGFQPQCISCRKKYYDENREKTKKVYLENLDKIKNYKKQNREKIEKNEI